MCGIVGIAGVQEPEWLARMNAAGGQEDRMIRASIGTLRPASDWLCTG
jgi:hypothetical protein